LIKISLLKKTFLSYRTAAMAEVTFEVVVKYLVQERNYPSQLANPMTEDEMLFLGKGLVVNYDDLSIDKVGKDGEIKISWNPETYDFDNVAKKWEGYEQYLQNGSSIRGKQHHIENVFELGLPIVFKRIAKLRQEKLIEVRPINIYNVSQNCNTERLISPVKSQVKSLFRT
jgi:5'-3' exonuclease